MADPERAALVRRAFQEHATGRSTTEQLLKQTAAWGLTNRRGGPLTSQAIGMLLRIRLYAGIVDVPEYGVRAKRGDMEPLISEELFYRMPRAVGSGRTQIRRRPGGAGPLTHQPKWRLAKAQPDPDFSYRSNATARFPSENSTSEEHRHGRGVEGRAQGPEQSTVAAELTLSRYGGQPTSGLGGSLGDGWTTHARRTGRVACQP